MLMKIGVYSNPVKDPDNSVRDAVFAAAHDNNIDVEIYDSNKSYNLIVSIGGDGTILRIAHECAKSGIPILGVNKGTIGFLTEIEPCDISAAFKKLLSHDYMLERRALLDVTID